MNSSHQRAINMTPFELMFGVTIRHQSSELQEITRIIEEENRNIFNFGREVLRAKANEAIEKITSENRRNYDSKRKEAIKYEVGSLVSIARTQFATGAKIKPKFFRTVRSH